MRYSHHLHLARNPRRHFRLHLASLILLGAAIVVLTITLKTPLDHHQLLFGFGLSLIRVVVAYLLALVVAVSLGLLTASSRATETILLPILDVAQSFPSFALLPFLIVYVGANGLSVIVILFINLLWPILFNVLTGIKEERRDVAEAARIFGARRWRYLIYYRLPMLRPWVVSGSIVSWGEAWDVIVGAEIIAGVAGAGHYLGTLGTAGRGQLLALGIAVYLFLIFVMNQLVWLPLLHRYTRFQSES